MLHTRIVKKNTTRILGSITFFPANRAVCEIVWKSMEETDRQATDSVEEYGRDRQAGHR